jgi:hypothetical protein
VDFVHRNPRSTEATARVAEPPELVVPVVPVARVVPEEPASFPLPPDPSLMAAAATTAAKPATSVGPCDSLAYPNAMLGTTIALATKRTMNFTSVFICSSLNYSRYKESPDCKEMSGFFDDCTHSFHESKRVFLSILWATQVVSKEISVIGLFVRATR